MLIPIQNTRHICIFFLIQGQPFLDFADRECSSTSLQARPYFRDARIIECDSVNVGFGGYNTLISISCDISQIAFMEWLGGNFRA